MPSLLNDVTLISQLANEQDKAEVKAMLRGWLWSWYDRHENDKILSVSKFGIGYTVKLSFLGLFASGLTTLVGPHP
jgi:hypothetical protein